MTFNILSLARRQAGKDAARFVAECRASLEVRLSALLQPLASGDQAAARRVLAEYRRIVPRMDVPVSTA
jgi:hypothetical protein